MWQQGWRDSIPATLSGCEWDIVVIGGGITGAGILLEAARHGLKALLVEQRDFAWGTSSRSSKLVHGGLRYLKEGKLHLTRDSVREREHLMHDARGLVEPQSFAFADYEGRKPGRWLFSLGLALYDMLAGRRERHYYRPDEFMMLAPHVGQEHLNGGLRYTDAKTDDARLVMRVLEEAVTAGGTALNYLEATQVLRNADGGKVDGAELRDTATGAIYAIRAKVIINATGAWADRLRNPSASKQKLRPLRGSHLIFPSWRLPVAQAISLMHPRDGRPVFAFPWEGVTLVGTTDIDHRADMRHEAAITEDELDYLLEAVDFQFPQLAIKRDDVISTYAGVRPVIDTGKADPSQEGRDHVVWIEDGLLTVTGGKLTTFRLIALDALKRAASLLPHWHAQLQTQPIFGESAVLPHNIGIGAHQRERLQGRHGRHAAALVYAAHQEELQAIPGTDTLWAELRWAARREAVMHLEDLMLRRTRLGLLVRKGAAHLLPRIRAICQAELGWNDERWESEAESYLALWRSHYSLPRQHDAGSARQTLAA